VLHAVDEAGRTACRRCEDTVKEHLNTLAGPDGLFAQLVWLGTDALSRGGGRSNNEPAVKSSKTIAPSPVRDQAMNLLGVGGVVHTLQRWVGLWYTELGFRQPVWKGQHHYVILLAPGGVKVRRPGQLDNTVRVLLNNLPWACEHRTDFGDFSREIWRFVEDCRTTIDPTIVRPSKILVGRCPNTVDNLICGAQLMADPFAAAIRCANCGTSWKRQEWPSLGRAMHPGR
jgi:hypothetical protein